jgi:hypothetical protein
MKCKKSKLLGLLLHREYSSIKNTLILTLYKFTEPHITENSTQPLLRDANPGGKEGLTVSKLIKESAKRIYYEKLLWLLCNVYSFRPFSYILISLLPLFFDFVSVYCCYISGVSKIKMIRSLFFCPKL